MKKLIKILRKIFGALCVVVLLAGGITVLGYAVAICVGGELATSICLFIFGTFFPWVIRLTAVAVGLGLLAMYLGKQSALALQVPKAEQE